jgi:hypothetical protein
MDVGTSVVGTGLVVAVGRWSQDKPLDIRQFVGIGVLAVGLTFLENADPKFAGQFGLLIFFAALFAYLLPITKKLGFTK